MDSSLSGSKAVINHTSLRKIRLNMICFSKCYVSSDLFGQVPTLRYRAFERLCSFKVFGSVLVTLYSSSDLKLVDNFSG